MASLICIQENIRRGGNAEYSPAQEVMKTYVTHVEIANMGTTQGDTAMGCKF